MGRLQGNLRQLTRLRDEEMAAAEGSLNKAVKARKAAQDTARRIQEHQWNLAYYSDATEGYWARQQGHDHSYLERSMLRDLNIARDAEEKGTWHLAQSRKAAYQLHLQQKHYIRIHTPGLWILLQVCLRGWRNKRALQYRSVPPIYHLQ